MKTKKKNSAASGGVFLHAEPQLRVDVYVADMVRAFSCVIEPKEGDKVLVADLGVQGGASVPVVLAVISRAGLGDAVISVPDPMAELSLTAQRIKVEAKTEIVFAAPETSFVGRSMAFIADRFNVLSQVLHLSGKKFKNMMGEQMSVAQTVVQRASNRVTVVDGVDNERVMVKILDTEVRSEAMQTGITRASKDVIIHAKKMMMN